MDFHACRCLSGIDCARDFGAHVLHSVHQWHQAAVMGFRHPEVHLSIDLISLYNIYANLIPPKICWTCYQCAALAQCVCDQPLCYRNRHLPSMLWTACAFSAALEIPGWLTNPVPAQTTSMSHGSENICLNTTWETTYTLLKDCRET